MSKWLLYGGIGIAAYAAFSYVRTSQAAPATDTSGSLASSMYLPLASYAPLSTGAVTGSSSGSNSQASNDALANMLREKYKSDNQVSIIQSVIDAITQLWQSGNGTSLKGSILVGDFPIGFDLTGGGNAYPGNVAIVPPIQQVSGSNPGNVNAVSSSPFASILDWLQSPNNAASPNTSASQPSAAPVSQSVAIPGAAMGSIPNYSISNGATPAPIDPAAQASGNPQYVGPYVVGYLPDGSFQFADGSTITPQWNNAGTTPLAPSGNPVDYPSGYYDRSYDW